MVPPRRARASRSGGRPRGRGGGPPGRVSVHPDLRSSPRTRGWSQPDGRAPAPDPVVPADAGVVPPSDPSRCRKAGRPRGRGGGPGSTCFLVDQAGSSPRTRGWSHRGVRRLHRRRVVPADAGVVPRPTGRRGRSPCRPRGRGGGPLDSGVELEEVTSSPRTRGWSRRLVERDVHLGVVPADAGVVPRRSVSVVSGAGRPRGRGGGPGEHVPPHLDKESSPRTRGWSRCPWCVGDARGVVPADAGVVPAPLARAL
ncbi:hypothetical protein SAMN05443637_12136 [Pseudonocardia thermophila]|uniref:Uncharacterized protein n=1 Tax=Pseudonocardia thermophila TaxID=1848 RepID=A0A1M6YSW0_PSETH|nr:hypothetical protein SAMN05443637_12136 [Pseudonocardia thermophila]